MHKIKSIKSVELFPAVLNILENDQNVRITVTGDSMMPFLRENIDSVELSKTDFKKLRFGQIPLIKRKSGQYILHRVVYKNKKNFYIAGDAQNWIEGPINPESLIAVVTKVWRKDKPIAIDNYFWKMLSFLWWLRLPAISTIKMPAKFLIRKVLRIEKR